MAKTLRRKLRDRLMSAMDKMIDRAIKSVNTKADGTKEEPMVAAVNSFMVAVAVPVALVVGGAMLVIGLVVGSLLALIF